MFSAVTRVFKCAINLQVLTSSLSIEKVQYEEDSNFWIGPRQVGLRRLIYLFDNQHARSHM